MTTANPGSGNSLRFVGGTASADEAGLSLRPWFRSKPTVVPWSNVEFVCPVPFVVPEAGGWKTYAGVPLSPDSLAKGLRIHVINVVLRERQLLWRSFGPAGKFWLLLALGYQALMHADDQVHPKQGVVGLDLHRRGQKARCAELVSFLNAIQRHSSFDLVGVG